MKKPKILHVDDDPDIREITKIALEVVGNLDVVQCGGGEEAIALAPKIAPDLLLLDLMMPGMSGQELLAELRKLPGLETTPVVFLTAKAGHGELDPIEATGAEKIIVKPYDAITLADQLREIIARRGG
jgi:CheY-like chemotaxis protein